MGAEGERREKTVMKNIFTGIKRRLVVLLWKHLADVFDDYLGTINDEKYDEWWTTNRYIAEVGLEDFGAWLYNKKRPLGEWRLDVPQVDVKDF